MGVVYPLSCGWPTGLDLNSGAPPPEMRDMVGSGCLFTVMPGIKLGPWIVTTPLQEDGSVPTKMAFSVPPATLLSLQHPDQKRHLLFWTSGEN